MNVFTLCWIISTILNIHLQSVLDGRIDMTNLTMLHAKRTLQVFLTPFKHTLIGVGASEFEHMYSYIKLPSTHIVRLNFRLDNPHLPSQKDVTAPFASRLQAVLPKICLESPEKLVDVYTSLPVTLSVPVGTIEI